MGYQRHKELHSTRKLTSKFVVILWSHKWDMQSKVNDKLVGIDIGTNYNCIIMWQQYSVEIIVNDKGNRTTISMDSFTPS